MMTDLATLLVNLGWARVDPISPSAVVAYSHGSRVCDMWEDGCWRVVQVRRSRYVPEAEGLGICSLAVALGVRVGIS